ncbi:unnamed protein product [Adineta steineri]|uniref:NAD(P)(+)--arginine ADP-ribosyltransferase n=2 Tax=Adineta steineri TaxID=433720 RepID=A0A819U3F7_9BILA|nr:unnamed protein product [Adineta steineri]CAF4088177.1 unnamed protein product [Adineta steineri]
MGSKSSKSSVKSSHKAIASYVHQPRQRMTQSYLLLWLDASINQTNEEYENTLEQIRTVTDDVNIFTQRDACIDFLTDAQADIESFLIVKDTMSQQIMPLINDIPQLNNVYIFNHIEFLHAEWIKKWDKIKSVHTNIKDLCKTLQMDVKQYNQDSIAVSFVTIDEMSSTDNLNQLEPNFMYSQIFKEILFDIKYGEQAIKQFTAYCRHNDCVSPPNINRFEREYHPEFAIWWYTFPSNINSMLNYALRTLDADIIITMGFFICHLHQKIQQLREQQVDSFGKKPFLVYRGQGLMKPDFQKLQKTKCGLMSFNNFLSTSTHREASLGFAQGALGNEDMVGILFIMSIDPCIRSAPFASIKEVSYFKEEEEILFSMHTVFRVVAIQQMDNENQLYEVELQLTSDDDQQLRLLTDRVRLEARGDNGWKTLGNLLLRIGQYNKAEELYNVLLEQTSDEGEKAVNYNQLGAVHLNQGDYGKAIWYFEQGLQITQKTLSSNHPHLATSYNNIGLVYNNMGEYPKALSFCEKALEIREKTLPSNHPDLAISYNNIGFVYQKMGEYSKALSYYEKAFGIFIKTLPSNHPALATSYNNTGNVYDKMGEYSKALAFYEKDLAIRQKALPSNHPSLATSYNNIGSVYKNMGEYSKALSFYKKTLDIRQKALSSNHPDLGTSYNNIGGVYSKMGEYSKALSYYEKALEIGQKALHSNHPSLAISYNNIGSVYDNMGEYSKALSFCEKALKIRQKTLPSNHPDLATSYNNIGSVYDNMGEYSKALSFYRKALDIRQKALSSNHPDLGTSYNNIGGVYGNMGKYSKALSFHENALDILKKTLPSNHTHLASSFNNIGNVYESMGEYSKALSLYGKALEIWQKTLSSNHPHLSTSYQCMGSVYKNMKDYSKALSYFEHALDIKQDTLPSTHPSIKDVKKSIEIVKKKL